MTTLSAEEFFSIPVDEDMEAAAKAIGPFGMATPRVEGALYLREHGGTMWDTHVVNGELRRFRGMP